MGYRYARFTALENHFGTYVRILSHRFTEGVKKFDGTVFAQYDELVAPFLGYGGPPQRGAGKWKAIGYLPMKSEDYHLPDMKGGYTDQSASYSTEWGIVRDTSAGNYLKKDESGDPLLLKFERVRHLGYYGHQNLKFATVRVILEWMKILGLDFMNYENHTVPQDFLADQKYIVSVSTPYSEVPREIRGKCII